MIFEDTWPVGTVLTRFLRFDSKGIKRQIHIHHFPLQLAYAMTIHKGSKKGGQLPYIALSRVITLNGLMLVRNVDRDSDVNRFNKSSDKDKLVAEFSRMEILQRKCIRGTGLQHDDRTVCKQLCEEENVLMQKGF